MSRLVVTCTGGQRGPKVRGLEEVEVVGAGEVSCLVVKEYRRQAGA